MPPNPPPSAALLRQLLEEKGVSEYAVAVGLKVNRAHLHRVLSGERTGIELRRSIAAFLETVEPPPKPADSEAVIRLIKAATHMFFLSRGRFESDICHGAGRPNYAEYAEKKVFTTHKQPSTHH